MSDATAHPLLEALTQNFDLEELRTLCFDLSVDFDSLRGEGKESKARELILHTVRRRQFPDLVSKVILERPHLKEALEHVLPPNLPPNIEPFKWQPKHWFAIAAATGMLFIGVIIILKLPSWFPSDQPPTLTPVGLNPTAAPPSPTARSTATSTPVLDVTHAQPDELLILLAAFRKPANSAVLPEQRIEKQLRNLTSATGLKLRPELVASREIGSASEAKTWGKAHGAQLVVWGWYDQYGIEANFTFPDWESTSAILPLDLSLDPTQSDALTFTHVLPEQVDIMTQAALCWVTLLKQQYDGVLEMCGAVIAHAEDTSAMQLESLQLADIYYYHGLASQQRKDSAQAYIDFTKAEGLRPDKLLIVFKSAEAAFYVGKLQESWVKIQIVLNSTPPPPTTLRTMSLIHAAYIQSRLGDIPQAISLTQQVVNLNSNFTAGWDFLAGLYIETQQWQEAQKAAQNAIDLKTSRGWTYINLGHAQLHLGTIEKAQLSYQRGLDLFSTAGDLGEIKKAIKELKDDQTKFPELQDDISLLLTQIESVTP